MQSEIIDVPDGSAAFPVNSEAKWPGISLRDYFAAKAMQSYLLGSATATALEGKIASWSYVMADAMLAARKAGAE